MALYRIKTSDGKFLAKIPAVDAGSAVNVLLEILSSGNSIEGAYMDPGVSDLLTKANDDLKGDLVVEEVHPKPTPRCAYCGKENPSKGEGDHVIARTFFAEEHQNNNIVSIRVPACPACNSSFSKDEEYYAFVIAMSFDCGDHPEARALFRNGSPFHRAFTKGKGPLGAIMRRSTMILVKYGGLFLRTPKVTIDYGRLNNLYDKVARGLYYYHTGDVFPAGLANYIAIIDSRLWNSKFEKLVQDSALRLGDDVFRYSYAIMGESPYFMMWLTSFYRGFHVAVLSIPERKPGDIIRPLRGAALSGVDTGTYRLLQVGESQAELQLIQDANGVHIINGETVQINKNLLYKFTIEDGA